MARRSWSICMVLALGAAAAAEAIPSWFRRNRQSKLSSTPTTQACGLITVNFYHLATGMFTVLKYENADAEVLEAREDTKRA